MNPETREALSDMLIMAIIIGLGYAAIFTAGHYLCR